MNFDIPEGANVHIFIGNSLPLALTDQRAELPQRTRGRGILGGTLKVAVIGVLVIGGFWVGEQRGKRQVARPVLRHRHRLSRHSQVRPRRRRRLWHHLLLRPAKSRRTGSRRTGSHRVLQRNCSSRRPFSRHQDKIPARPPEMAPRTPSVSRISHGSRA